MNIGTTTGIDQINERNREILNVVAEQGRTEQLNELSQNSSPLDFRQNASRDAKTITPEESDLLITDIKELSQIMNKQIQFSMDYENQEMVVRIINRETNEVIRQLPPEELRELHRKLKETAEMLGLVVDARA